jgi:hypothetical protein
MLLAMIPSLTDAVAAQPGSAANQNLTQRPEPQLDQLTEDQRLRYSFV